MPRSLLCAQTATDPRATIPRASVDLRGNMVGLDGKSRVAFVTRSRWPGNPPHMRSFHSRHWWAVPACSHLRAATRRRNQKVRASCRSDIQGTRTAITVPWHRADIALHWIHKKSDLEETMIGRLTRRTVLAGTAAAGAAATLGLGTARAQAAWPNRPITLIVPWGAGGGTDATARIIAALLETRPRPAGQRRQPHRRLGRRRPLRDRDRGARRLHDRHDHGRDRMMHWQGLTELNPTATRRSR